jgi:transposase
MSHRAIARSLKIARKTVKAVLEEHEVQRSEPHSALVAPPTRSPRPSQLDVHRETIDGFLLKFPDITAQRILEEIRPKGYSGGYTVVKDLMRRLRPARKPEPSRPAPVYGPGKMAECDWSPYTVRFTSGTSSIVQAFGYVLVHSHRKAYRFYRTNDIHALMDGHVQAFAQFGGAAEETKYDSQKPVVLRWEGNQPIYNLRFVDFATHYSFRLSACRRGHPNDKPRVERSFWELEKSFFNGREFRDMEDLCEQLAFWSANICDVRPHKKAKRNALELFAEERPHLQPLPTHHYDTARVLYRLCDIEGFVSWAGNRYSLPYDYVTDILPVRVTQGELFVYAANLNLIARHELRIKGAGEDSELPGHHPRRSARTADLDQLRKVFEDMGGPAQAFLSGLERERTRSAAHHASHILALRQRYNTADLVRALDHALRFDAFEHTAIERILLSTARPRRLDEYVVQQHVEELFGETGPQLGDLTEYDTLPCWDRPRSQGETTCPPSETTPGDQEGEKANPSETKVTPEKE